MSKTEEIHLILSRNAGCFICPRLKTALRKLARYSRNKRIPGLLHATSVAEQPGLSTIKRQPDITARDTCNVITILSANLWHDYPFYRLQINRLKRFSDLVQEVGADILLLQEVTRRPKISVDEWLSNHLGMSYVYSRVNGHRDIGFEEGLAIYSRFPIIETPLLMRVSKGCNPFVRRLALGTTIKTSCGSLIVFSVHLGLPRKQNAAQLTNLQNWINQIPSYFPVIIGGDFNSPEKHVHIQQTQKVWHDLYRSKNPNSDGTTYEFRVLGKSMGIRHRLDYIFLRQGQTPWNIIDVTHCEPLDGPHSDHKVVVARIAPE